MKRLVTQNVTDQFGRFTGQLFYVWDTERKVMVYPPDPRKYKAEDFIAQGELEL